MFIIPLMLAVIAMDNYKKNNQTTNEATQTGGGVVDNLDKIFKIELRMKEIGALLFSYLHSNVGYKGYIPLINNILNQPELRSINSIKKVKDTLSNLFEVTDYMTKVAKETNRPKLFYSGWGGEDGITQIESNYYGFNPIGRGDFVRFFGNTSNAQGLYNAVEKISVRNNKDFRPKFIIEALKIKGRTIADDPPTQSDYDFIQKSMEDVTKFLTSEI